MSAITPAPPPPTAGAAPFQGLPLYRLSVAQYHAMLDAGILKSGDPVELIEGLLVRKMTKNPPHRVSTRRTRRALEAATPPGWGVDSQEPITLATSEPEPDAFVAREDALDASDDHPTAAEVALVVEVADSTLDYDRAVKRPLYAGSGIPVYWIVNLIDGQVEVHSAPAGQGATADYTQRQDCHPGDSVPVVIVGQVVAHIPVADLLP